MDVSWFVNQLPVEEHLAGFQYLAIVDEAPVSCVTYTGYYVNISLHFFKINAQECSWLSHTLMSCLVFLGIGQTVFLGIGCTVSHFHQ